MSAAAPGRVLVTGATGFIGRCFTELLDQRGIGYRRALRAPHGGQTDDVVVGDIGPDTDWSAALRDIDVVVHLAGRAHVLKEQSANPREEFMRVNAAGTGALAAASAAAGVRRMVFVSSIGVLGRESETPLRNDSPPRPHNDYAESKLAGEESALSAAQGRLEVAIVRPPLVHGPGVPANFARLLAWVDRQIPLPLGAVKNRRSLVAADNLCDLLLLTTTHPAAAGGRFLVSDDHTLSTPDLMREIGALLKRRVRLLPVPVSLMYGLGSLAGVRGQLVQLCGSLEVDLGGTRSRLGWQPPVPFREALRRTADWYLASRGRAS